MQTLTLSPLALEQLGRILRDGPLTQCPVLLVEVLDQKPELLTDDSNNQPESSKYAHTHTQAS